MKCRDSLQEGDLLSPSFWPILGGRFLPHSLNRKQPGHGTNPEVWQRFGGCIGFILRMVPQKRCKVFA